MLTTGSSSSDDEDGEEAKQKPHKPKPADGMSPYTVGDEDEIESEQVFNKRDDVESISNDFYYNYEEHASKAAVSDMSGLPSNLMTL